MKKTFSVSLVFLLVLTYLIFASPFHTESSEQLSPENLTIPLIVEKSKAVQVYSYTQNRENNSPLASELKYWVKNDKARMETTLFEQRHPLYTYGLIFKENKEPTQYQIKHTGTSSMSFSAFRTGRFEGIRAQTFLSFIDKLETLNSQITGQDMIGNRSCVVVEYEGGKVWIDSADFVPLRVEDNTGIIEFSDVRVGSGSVNIDDLQVPAEAESIVARQTQPSPKNMRDFPIVSEPDSKNRPLSKEELATFLQKTEVYPLAVKDIGLWTILLYKTETEIGTYQLTWEPDGKIGIGKSGKRSINNSHIPPVLISGGGSYSKGIGSVGYITLIFNDPAIQKNASEVSVYEDREKVITEPVKEQVGLILPGQLKSNTNVIIVDARGNELYNLKTDIQNN